MPLSPKVKKLLLQTAEKYGVAPDLIDTATIDPSLTYDEVKPMIEEMVSLLSPDYVPPEVGIREARREENQILKRQREEITVAIREAIERIRKGRIPGLSLKDKFRRLKTHAEYFDADAKVLMAEERRIQERGGTIDYTDVLDVLKKQRELIRLAKEAFKEFPYLLHHLMRAEKHINQGIQMAKWNLGIVSVKPYGITTVGVAVIRASYALDNAHKEGIEKEF